MISVLSSICIFLVVCVPGGNAPAVARQSIFRVFKSISQSAEVTIVVVPSHFFTILEHQRGFLVEMQSTAISMLARSQLCRAFD